MFLKSWYILQSAVEHSCIPAAAPCSVLQCLTAAATLRLIAGLLHRHCTIATLQGPHFMMGGDGGTAVHLMQSSSIALFMVCACLQSLVYWRVRFWSTDRRRTLPMLHRLSAKWIPPPHLHITWHLNMCLGGKNVLTKGKYLQMLKCRGYWPMPWSMLHDQCTILRGAAELFACYLLFKAAITQCAGVEPVFISIVGDTHCSSHQPLALSLNPSHKHTSEESHKCTHVKRLNSY